MARPKTRREPLASVSAKVEPHLADKLNTAAKQNGTTRSSYIHRLLEKHLGSGKDA